MRKFLKILGINFLILLLCLIVSEIVIYSIAKEQYNMTKVSDIKYNVNCVE